MEFPEREEDIVEFALRIAAWLEQHPDAFPGIPFSAAELRSSVDVFNAAQTASVDAEARGGTWEFVARAVDNDFFLGDQPRGVDFDLRVVAVNKAGAGQPSAAVTVVL